MPRIATVVSDGLSLRPSIPFGQPIAVLAKGEHVLVLDSKVSKTVWWLWVRRANGVEGYIAEMRLTNGKFTRFAEVNEIQTPPDVPAVGDSGDACDCDGCTGLDPSPPIPDNSPLGADDDPPVSAPQPSFIMDDSTLLLGCLSLAFVVALIIAWALG